MPFGEIICGSPGSGKSTYCYGKYQLFNAMSPKRPVHVVNLDPAAEDGWDSSPDDDYEGPLPSTSYETDPANSNRGRSPPLSLPYPASISISSLITLSSVQTGGMLYCMEYLEKNFDWLEEKLQELGQDIYVLFDLPGQVELSTNHDSLKRIIELLQSRCGFRLCTIHLVPSLSITSPSTYISSLLLSLRTMLQLELPHVNVLSKIDLVGGYARKDMDFNLDFYTDVQDLSYLENALENESGGSGRFTALNKTLISIIEDYSLVGFETLAVEDKQSMLHLTNVIDRATGYVFVPKTSPDSTTEGVRKEDGASLEPSAQPNEYALFSSAMGAMPSLVGGKGGRAYDVRDVQERYIDYPEIYDAYEKKEWRKEAEAARAQRAGSITMMVMGKCECMNR
ncbi:hypothetical protein BT96DRAFT_913829 [Gymnopus androsaceus JB14]|uniref:GPN-loop GTPase 2 n=1 Tax=Gymnopus androsaceus JB14 TaxID=1447944 RepID=A0A6A4IJH6_9AGAR|nr:hypothetical protein BT96DRAFT_913829 [Gymnopus androsaceus JB14]